MRVERIILKDHGDVAILRRQVIDDLAADINGAGGDFLEARDHAQRRALAATRGADQNDEFIVGNIEIDAAHRFDVVEALGHVTQRDFGHGSSAFRGACGQAGDVVIHEERVDHERRRRGEQRAGHQHAPFVDVAADQAGDRADG